jgi:hypothetical protein
MAVLFPTPIPRPIPIQLHVTVYGKLANGWTRHTIERVITEPQVQSAIPKNIKSFKLLFPTIPPSPACPRGNNAGNGKRQTLLGSVVTQEQPASECRIIRVNPCKNPGLVIFQSRSSTLNRDLAGWLVLLRGSRLPGNGHATDVDEHTER